jgi:hypothetical protein
MSSLKSLVESRFYGERVAEDVWNDRRNDGRTDAVPLQPADTPPIVPPFSASVPPLPSCDCGPLRAQTLTCSRCRYVAVPGAVAHSSGPDRERWRRTVGKAGALLLGEWVAALTGNGWTSADVEHCALFYVAAGCRP